MNITTYYKIESDIEKLYETNQLLEKKYSELIENHLKTNKKLDFYESKYYDLLKRVDRHDNELSDIIDYEEKTSSKKIAELQVKIDMLQAKTNKLHENHDWLSYVIMVIGVMVVMF